MNKISVLSFLLSIIASSAYGFQEDFEYADKIYDPNIKTVRLFPLIEHQDRELFASAMPIYSPYSLMLKFDHLYAEYESYYVKFIHCNADWSPSRLFALDYLDEFNEFNIEEFELSFNTHVPYVHYQYILPRFKVPGNYVLMVYRESEEDVVLTRRFMIHESQVSLADEIGNAGMTSISQMNQEIQFQLDYKGKNIDNPYRNIKVTIRQNQRWDNAIHSLTPTFVDEASRLMEFRHFAGENMFNAGNQFRFFDLRSLRYFGRNVETVDLNREVPLATLEPESSRGFESYAENDDKNGKYFIPHPFETDYAHVQFFIQSKKLNADVFLAGEFSGWAREDEFKLNYVEELQGYYGQTLLKQGIYDYQYLVEGPGYGENYLEGDHFQTENEYDIMVYYHSFQLDTDLLIGYFRISRNPRF